MSNKHLLRSFEYYKARMTWLVLLVFLALSAVAQDMQKFQVASFGLDPFDMSAQSDKYKKEDGDGQLYAIIKVTSDRPDDELEKYLFDFGNMNHLVQGLHDQELWLYVQRHAKHVTISRKGFTSIRRYGLDTSIEPGRTYVMKLSVAAKQVSFQMVQFKVGPATSKAVIMVTPEEDGAREELFGSIDENGMVAKMLKYGAYTYRIMAENYHELEGRFELADKTNTHVEEVTLRSNFSEVTLQTTSPADIYVNGQLRGNRSWTGPLKAGDYVVECRQPNHKPSQQTITVSENDNRTFELTPPTPITGDLSVTSQPIGAAISIDGKSYGQTPRMINDLLIGRHTVTLTLKNYQVASQTVELKEGGTEEVNLKLQKGGNTTVSQTPAPAASTIKGHVKDSHGKPMIGAAIIVDGTSGGTVTDLNGEFTVKCSEGATLSVSYVGYVRQKVSARNGMVVTMREGGKSKSYRPHFYLAGSFQPISLMGVGGSLGIAYRGLSIEGGCHVGLKESEWIGWSNGISTTGIYTYKPISFRGRLGYSFYLYRFSFTPLLGANVTAIKSDGLKSEGFATSLAAGLRVNLHLFSRFSLFVEPEYAFAVQQSDTYKLLSDVSSDIKGWANGFNVSMGLKVGF